MGYPQNMPETRLLSPFEALDSRLDMHAIEAGVRRTVRETGFGESVSGWARVAART